MKKFWPGCAPTGRAAIFCVLAGVVPAAPAFLPEKPDYASADPATVAAAVTRDKGPKDHYTTVLGPFWTIGPASFLASLNPLQSLMTANLLAFQADDGGVIELRLEMMFSYYKDSWHQYETTSVDGDGPTKTEVIKREALGCMAGTCGYRETITAALDPKWVVSMREKGFRIKASAKDGTSQIVSVPATYLQGYLQALHPTGLAPVTQPGATAVPPDAPAPTGSAPTAPPALAAPARS